MQLYRLDIRQKISTINDRLSVLGTYLKTEAFGWALL